MLGLSTHEQGGEVDRIWGERRAYGCSSFFITSLLLLGLYMVSLFKERTFDFNGSNWVASGCSLAPPEGWSFPAPAETKETKPGAKAAAAETKEAKPKAKAAPVKLKPAAKDPATTLSQTMEQDVIPALQSILEAQDDITDLELTFMDNRLCHLHLIHSFDSKA